MSTATDAQKIYEFACLISPDLNEEQYKAWLVRLSDLIQKQKGELINEAQIREQKLAYPIAKKTRAYLAVIKYKADPEVPKTVMDEIKHEKDILRCLTINVPKERKRPVKTKKAKPEKTISPSVSSSAEKEPQKNDLEEIDKRIEEILKSAS